MSAQYGANRLKQSRIGGLALEALDKVEEVDWRSLCRRALTES